MIFFWIFFVIVIVFGFVVFRGAPYVPSRRKYIHQAFTKLYKITNKDVLVDVGSGDGVVLREAAKLGAKAMGYELNPVLVLISKFLSRKNKNIDIHLSDYWSTKIPNNVTVIYVFAVSRDINNLTKFLQIATNQNKHSVYLISYAGDFHDFKLIKTLEPYRLYLINPLQIN